MAFNPIGPGVLTTGFAEDGEIIESGVTNKGRDALFLFQGTQDIFVFHYQLSLFVRLIGKATGQYRHR